MIGARRTAQRIDHGRLDRRRGRRAAEALEQPAHAGVGGRLARRYALLEMPLDEERGADHGDDGDDEPAEHADRRRHGQTEPDEAEHTEAADDEAPNDAQLAGEVRIGSSSGSLRHVTAEDG
ncbi:MAG: hypothetical protein ACHQ02_11040 [Candidatus Limnocylindrales bacterium]